MAADGSVIIDIDVDDKKAQAELNRLQRQIDSIKRSMEQKNRKRGLLEQEAADLEKKYYKEAARYGEDDPYVKGILKQYDVKQSQIERIDEQIKYQTADLKAAEEQAGKYAAQVSQVGNASIDAGKKVTAFGKRILGLAKRVFVFSLITKALRNVRKWLGDLIKTNSEAAAAVGSLKGAFLTLAQPILNSVIPALTKLINWLAKVVSVIAGIVSALFGTTAQASAAAAEALYNEQNAIDGVGGSAKKAAKQLANFDEINKLAGEDAGGGGGAGANAMAPIFDAFSNFQLPDWLDDFIGSFKITFNDVLFDWSDLSGEEIAEKAIAGLSMLAGGVIGFAIGGVPGAIWGSLAGLVLGLVIDTVTFDHDGRISNDEAWRLIRTALLGLFGAVVGFEVGGIVGGAIGLTVGLILSLLITGTEIQYSKYIEQKAHDTELGKLVYAALNNSKAQLEASTELQLKVDSITGEVSPEQLANIERAKDLVNQIFSLDATENKTAGQIELLKAQIEELNNMGLEGVTLSFDEATGAVIGTKDAILDTIDALLRQYQVEALRESYIEAFRSQYEAYSNMIQQTKDLEEANRLYEQALADVTAAEEAYTQAREAHYSSDTFDPDFYGLDEWIEPIRDETEALDTAKKSLEEAKAAQDNLSEALQTSINTYNSTQTKVEELGAAYEALVSSLADDTEEAVAGGKNIMEGTAEGIDEGYATAEDAITRAHKALQDAANEVDGIHSPSTVYKEHGQHIMEGLAEGIRDYGQLAIDAMRDVLNSLAALAETGLNNIVTKFNGVATDISGAEGANIHLNRIPQVYIPRLASGAVIPPNREFLALLGDQKRGTNVEAPLDTIVAAFRSVMAEQGNRGQTIVLELDRRELGRAVADVSRLEAQRVGTKIGGSYA